MPRLAYPRLAEVAQVAQTDGMRERLAALLSQPLRNAIHSLALAAAALEQGPDAEAGVIYLLDGIAALTRDLATADRDLSH
jgi:hypothetical protein